MDYRTFYRTTEALLNEIERGLEPDWGHAIRSMLYHGEEGMAVDQLVRGLIEDQVPVTSAQRDTLYELVAYFPPPDGGWSRHVPFLMTATIDWLTVVDDG